MIIFELCQPHREQIPSETEHVKFTISKEIDRIPSPGSIDYIEPSEELLKKLIEQAGGNQNASSLDTTETVTYSKTEYLPPSRDGSSTKQSTNLFLTKDDEYSRLVTQEEYNIRLGILYDKALEELLSLLKEEKQNLKDLRTISFDRSFMFIHLSPENIHNIIEAIPPHVENLLFYDQSLSGNASPEKRAIISAIFESIKVDTLVSLQLCDVYTYLFTIMKILVEKGYHKTLKNLKFLNNRLLSSTNMNREEVIKKLFTYINLNFPNIVTLEIGNDPIRKSNSTMFANLLHIAHPYRFILSECGYLIGHNQNSWKARMAELAETLKNIHPNVMEIKFGDLLATDDFQGAIGKDRILLLYETIKRGTAYRKQELAFDLTGMGLHLAPNDSLSDIVRLLSTCSKTVYLEWDLLCRIVKHRDIDSMFSEGTRIICLCNNVFNKTQLTIDQNKIIDNLPSGVIEIEFRPSTKLSFIEPKHVARRFNNLPLNRKFPLDVTPRVIGNDVQGTVLYPLTPTLLMHSQLYSQVASGFFAKLAKCKPPTNTSVTTSSDVDTPTLPEDVICHLASMLDPETLKLLSERFRPNFVYFELLSKNTNSLSLSHEKEHLKPKY